VESSESEAVSGVVFLFVIASPKRGAMKSALRNAMLLLIVVGAYQPARAQTPEVAQLLRDVLATYASLQSYSATGEVVSGVTTDGSSAILPAGQSQEIHSTFTIKVARPQMYKIVWEQKTGQKDFSFSSKGAVWSDGESRFVSIAGQTMQPSDTETAIAMATGVSGGAANTIPSIFFSLSSNGITAVSNVAVLAGGELVDGEDCYVVKAHAGSMDRSFWISKASKLILQEMTVSSGSTDAPELTESDLRKVLELMGQKATDDAVRTLRDQLANTQQIMKSVKSSFRIERHREIKTNAPMLPADFR
jgi:outer membrane lipoprotein-sorting protein